MTDLEELIERYIADLTIQNFSPHSIRAYKADLKRFPDFANGVALIDINVHHVRAWMAALCDQNVGAKTIRRHVAVLRGLFRFGRKSSLIAINPAELVLLPKMPLRLPEVPTVAQTEALLAGVKEMAKDQSPALRARDLLCLELLYGCGLRVSELVGLNLEDIDRTECWLRIRGKGRKERQVPYGSKAKEALEEYLLLRPADPMQNALLVSGRTSLQRRSRATRPRQRLGARSVGNIVKRYASCLLGNSTIHPHTFRHAFATHLLDSGIDLRSLQDLLGHSSISSVQVYTKVSPGGLIAAYDGAHPRS